MKLSEIMEILEADNLGAELDDSVVVETACCADLLSDVLAFTRSTCMLMTGLIHTQVIRTAEMLDLRLVVIVRGKEPGEDIIKLALEKNIPLMRTNLTMFVSAGRLYEAGLTGEGLRK